MVSESDPSWLKKLGELNAVIAETGQPLMGNLFYDHLQADYVDSPPNPILAEATGSAMALEGREASRGRGERRALRVPGVDVRSGDRVPWRRHL